MTTKAGAALYALTALLRGEPAVVTDWTTVVALANKTWLSPQLYCAIERAGRLDQLPPDARDYLAFIHDSNLERNRRLRAQLLEAVAAFNGVGIWPTLLKGSVALFVPPEDGLGSRMTSDLDIGVEPHEPGPRGLASWTWAMRTSPRSAAWGGRRTLGWSNCALARVHRRCPANSARWNARPLWSSARACG